MFIQLKLSVVGLWHVLNSSGDLQDTTKFPSPGLSTGWKQGQKTGMSEFLFIEFAAFFNLSKHISKAEVLCSP